MDAALQANLLSPDRGDGRNGRLPDIVMENAYPAETAEFIEGLTTGQYLTPAIDHEKEEDIHEVGRMWKADEEIKLELDLLISSPVYSIEPAWSYTLDIKEMLEAAGLQTEHALFEDRRDFIDRRDLIEVEEVPVPKDESKVASTLSRPPEDTWLEDLLNGRLKSFAPDLKEGLVFPDLHHGAPSVMEAPPTLPGLEPSRPQATILNFGDLFKSGWGEDEEGGEKETGRPDKEDEDKGIKGKEVGGSDRSPSSSAVNNGGEEGRASASAEVQGDLVTEIALQHQIETLEQLLAEPTDWWADKGRKGVAKSWKSAENTKGKEYAVIDDLEGVEERFQEIRENMAMEFPFELDGFQKQAIYHLERGESVFVAAHTSAGKTVVAEYAFALAAQHYTRAVYTSPIKTISNQKFRDFSKKFDVGLLTGDVSIKPEASGLIMTTEILRSMLYKGADLVRDIEWVIFDEVHYVNDAERGVVWEEAIIMLPPHVNLILLSATVPNINEFADWIGRTKKKKIYVTGTTKRPVPLEHCLWYSGELYKICEHETFLPQGMKAASKAHKEKTAPKVAGGRGGGAAAGRGHSNQARGGTGHGSAASQMARSGGHGGGSGGSWRSETSQWYSLINYLGKKSLLPVVVFCFSKNRCDQAADSLSNLDLTSTQEKSEIVVFCRKAFSRLEGSDQRLPQILRISELLRRGIGAHHAGLLPIVKEVVEMLFCRGVIKVLFSTETFAMGVNAPARTVAFHSIRKHDGKNFRQLYSGEYTQMAGRAGRRGLDKVGTVVLMCWDEVPEEGDLKRLLTGKATKLESKFRLTYNMILNMLCVEDLKVEDMLKNSFAEFHAQRALPEQQLQLLKGETALSQMNAPIECILGDPTIEEYSRVAAEAEKLRDDLQDLMRSKPALQCLSVGRVIAVRLAKDLAPSLGVVLRPFSYDSVNSPKTCTVLAIHRGPEPPPPAPSPAPTTAQTNVRNLENGVVIIRSREDGSVEDKYSMGGASRRAKPASKLQLPHYSVATGGTPFGVVEIDSRSIVSITVLRSRGDPGLILEEGSSTAIWHHIQQFLEFERHYPGGPPAVDPVRDLKAADYEVVKKYKLHEHLLSVLSSNKCHLCPKLQEHYSIVRKQHQLHERVKELKYKLSDAALQQMPEFNIRVGVLQELGYVDEARVVQVKGRVARQISSGDELIATEAIFHNQLDDLTPPEVVALLSSLVFQQKDASEPSLTQRLSDARHTLLVTALRLGDLQAKHGLTTTPDEFVSATLNFGLMEVVYEWAKGTEFANICELTNVPEGSIVRTIMRLHETCKEFRNAALLVGDSALQEKMEAASISIKRDIVFAASLYVTGPDDT